MPKASRWRDDNPADYATEETQTPEPKRPRIDIAKLKRKLIAQPRTAGISEETITHNFYGRPLMSPIHELTEYPDED